ncbi:MAG: hypothetical protein V1848_03845 [Candidatus Magasanikbacteria bacterium]
MTVRSVLSSDKTTKVVAIVASLLIVVAGTGVTGLVMNEGWSINRIVVYVFMFFLTTYAIFNIAFFVGGMLYMIYKELKHL